MSGASEWEDMMPHRIEVYQTTVNNEGKRVTKVGTQRVYRCLLDDSTTTRRDASGEEVSVAFTAYCDAIPVDQETPQDIDAEKEHVKILEPWNEERAIAAIDRHYWTDGSLHNFVVRFR